MEPLVTLGNFEGTERGLQVQGTPTLDACANVGRTLLAMEKHVQFWLGDFVNIVVALHGEESSQILDPDEGWTESTLSVYAWVCRQVPEANRHPGLTFSHHQVVAALDADEQVQWLAQAADGDDGKRWSVQRLKAAVKDGKDPPVTGWWLAVNCGSAKVRKEIQTMIAGVAVEVKQIDRRAVRSLPAKAKKGAKKK